MQPEQMSQSEEAQAASIFAGNICFCWQQMSLRAAMLPALLQTVKLWQV